MISVSIGVHGNLSKHIDAWTKWLPFCNNILKCIFLQWQILNFDQISVKSIPKGLVYNTSPSFKVNAWHWVGNRPLPQPMMTQISDPLQWSAPVAWCLLLHRHRSWYQSLKVLHNTLLKPYFPGSNELSNHSSSPPPPSCLLVSPCHIGNPSTSLSPHNFTAVWAIHHLLTALDAYGSLSWLNTYIHFSQRIFLKFCTECGSYTAALCPKFQNDSYIDELQMIEVWWYFS